MKHTNTSKQTQTHTHTHIYIYTQTHTHAHAHTHTHTHTHTYCLSLTASTPDEIDIYADATDGALLLFPCGAHVSLYRLTSKVRGDEPFCYRRLSFLDGQKDTHNAHNTHNTQARTHTHTYTHTHTHTHTHTILLTPAELTAERRTLSANDTDDSLSRPQN